MLENYKKHVAERAEQNIPPLPLDADQTSELIKLLKEDHKESDFLLNKTAKIELFASWKSERRLIPECKI